MKDRKIVVKVGGPVTTLLVAAFGILKLAKVDPFTHWSWWLVTIPWWGPILLVIAGIILFALGWIVWTIFDIRKDREAPAQTMGAGERGAMTPHRDAADAVIFLANRLLENVLATSTLVVAADEWRQWADDVRATVDAFEVEIAAENEAGGIEPDGAGGEFRDKMLSILVQIRERVDELDSQQNVNT